MIFYHVVTERPMSVGQKIRFDAEHVSGVSARVAQKLPAVREIYAHPEAYRAETIEHHTSVALRETAIEDVRRSQYPMLPSRLACLYGSRTLEEARKWASLFVEWGRPTYAIVKMEGERCFIGDAAKCFSGRTSEAENMRLAERYWQNPQDKEHENEITELLVDGEITVLEIVEDIRANISE